MSEKILTSTNSLHALRLQKIENSLHFVFRLFFKKIPCDVWAVVPILKNF
ncbi:hypothetical protein SAMN04488104_105312 [Algoriphagus faecimaris]|uniref:Uncharacterized protein n=1 Tax=Algoriphagus faecimaris TaxID=686796 RepID=A0A1G6X9A7_9BACT|nr:hypothetical protein SAMN04488104_105312 [Algoriphagus faecimaris]